MKKILINENPWEIRVAITINGTLQNVYFASRVTRVLERSFFKGQIIKVLPGIQTAFVEIGQEKAGFLHISEIDRELAIAKMGALLGIEEEEQEKRPARSYKPDIANILKEGDSVLVQVSKEPVYEKGAKLSTCFTLPGRFIVLMPNIPRIGISKRIESREERIRLKTVLTELLPKGMGAIIRTSAENRSLNEIGKDVAFLVHTWNSIETRYKKAEHKDLIYEDLDLSFQIVRDHLDDDVDEVIIDNKDLQKRLYKFAQGIAPEHAMKVKLYEDRRGLFEAYGLEKQIVEALDKKVFLKSGGSIIIETTEAMTVIDVNTGRYTGASNLEETVLKTNLEAAQEVVRQLRLRNIGGLIVIDFIDMMSGAHRQKLFKYLEKTLREHDKYQSVVLKVSEFGIVQMTRKRSGKTLQQQLTNECTRCSGLGFVKSIQTESFEVLRGFKRELINKNASQVTLTVSSDVFDFISSIEYNSIMELEKSADIVIMLEFDNKLAINDFRVSYRK